MWLLRLVLSQQIGTARNLREPWRRRALRAFWVAVLMVKALWLGLRATRKEQLGSAVIYDGRRWSVSNWSNGPSPTLVDGEGRVERNVPRELIRNVRGPREWLHRFRSGVGFYVLNWLGIEVNRRLYPR